MKYIVVLGDGMADYPVEHFGGKTILEAANKPTIDYMAQHGEMGMVKTVQEGMKPGSDVANLSVMGYDTKECYSGRSPLEAASIGVVMKEDDVSFRCNLVTLSDEENYEDKTMVDYSAGEISTEEAAELIEALAKELDTEDIKYYSGISYRHLIIWAKGSTNVTLTPPHDISDRKIADYLPKGDGADKFLEMMKKSEKILREHPVNKARAAAGKNMATSIWPWGEGTKPHIGSFYEKYQMKASVISAVDLIKGIAKCAGMDSIDVEGATGNCETNWDGKAQAALDAVLGGSDFVYIHMEAPDEMGHQGLPDKKKFAVETIDQRVVKFLKDELEKRGIDYKMLIMPDHPTPISLKTHVSDPVPYVIYDSTNECDKNAGLRYTEKDAEKTGIYVEKGYKLMDHFLDKE
ncbi:MAG: cofactor-independent phosphoglycerate mutase [Clostridiales bacterium]|nr:cofactor-independent phosphoglycerate mutase [Clostridiales bacterium]